MPFTDDDIVKIQNLPDWQAKKLFDGMTPEVRADLASSLKAYNSKKQQPQGIKVFGAPEGPLPTAPTEAEDKKAFGNLGPVPTEPKAKQAFMQERQQHLLRNPQQAKTDDDLAIMMGYDPEEIKKSKAYKPGSLVKLWNEQGAGKEEAPLSKTAVGREQQKRIEAAGGPPETKTDVFNRALEGAQETYEGLARGVAQKIIPSIFGKEAGEYANLKEALLQFARKAKRPEGEGLGYEIGKFGGAFLLPGPKGKIFGGGAMNALKTIGKSAATGAAYGMAQPVVVDPNDPNSLAKQTAQNTLTGGLMAPATQAGIEGLGKLGSKLLQKSASLAPEDVQAWFKGKISGKHSDVLQRDLQQQKDAARIKASKPFQELRAEGGSISMEPYVQKIDSTIEELKKSGFTDRDAAIAKLTKMRDIATEGPTTWGKALDIGSDINDLMHQAQLSGDRNLNRLLKPIKDAHQQSLDIAGKPFGDKYKQAKELWKTEVGPWENPTEGSRLVNNFINSPTPDKAMSALLRAKSEDQVGIFLKKLSKDKGLPALQAGLVDNVIEDSMVNGRVDPTKFLSELKKRKDAYNLTFSGESKWMMDGLEKVMKNAKFASKVLGGQWLRNVPGVHILAPAANENPGIILQSLFTSKIGRKLLLQASSATPSSKLMDSIVDKMAIHTGKAGSIQATKPTTKIKPSAELEEEE